MYFPLILGEKSSFSRKNALFLKFFAKKFGSNKKIPTFAIPNETNTVSKHAEVAQLVEHNLAKVGVASSSLVFRSKNKKSAEMLTFVLKISPDGVQSYVSRPCALGTAFLFYVYSLPCTHMHFPDYQAQQDKKRPPSKERDLEYDATRGPFRKRHP